MASVRRSARLRGLSPSGTPHIGYKLCRDRRLVTLQITGETNESRPDVVDAQHAKLRTSRATVLSIQHADTNEIFTAAASYYDSTFVYVVGKEMTTSEYDENPKEICGGGIHYFLSREAAFYYDSIPSNWCGIWYVWRNDGRLGEKSNFKNGKNDGLCEIYDGAITTRYNFCNGKLLAS